MCFRIEQEGEDFGAVVRAIEELFSEIVIYEREGPGVNIALTDPAMVVLQRKELQMRSMRFGLWPHWKKTPPSFDMNLGNARAETVDELPSFKEPFERRRCLIPVTGFYEWRLDAGEKKKTPYRVMTEEPVFYLAGVWDYWAAQNLASFAIITTEPNKLISTLHNRMPVILPKEAHREWLDPANNDVEMLKAMLQPYPAERMAYQAFDRYVSNAKNKDKTMIKAVGEKVTMNAGS